MTFAHLFAFNIALLVAIASPGPSLLFLIKSTLSHGRRTGILTALGLGTMAVGWTLMAILGLDGLFSLFPWAYVTLKIAGASYLIWIAINTWRHANTRIKDAKIPSGRRAYLSGIMVNLGNPKSVFFAAAVLLVIFPVNLTGAEKSLIVFNHLAVEFTVQPALAILLSTAGFRARYLGAKPLLDRISAIVLGALGLRLLLNR